MQLQPRHLVKMCKLATLVCPAIMAAYVQASGQSSLDLSDNELKGPRIVHATDQWKVTFGAFLQSELAVDVQDVKPRLYLSMITK